MKKILLISPLLLTMLACSPSQEIEFEKSSGQTNKVKTGSRFHLNLSEDHKVGSGLWSLDQDFDTKVIGYVNSMYTAEDGGSVDFHFEALEKGKTEIHLTQSFARDTIQKTSFVVEVE
jgi:predicted secreted protein